jgi:hypothetical protein
MRANIWASTARKAARRRRPLTFERLMNEVLRRFAQPCCAKHAIEHGAIDIGRDD